MTFRLSPVIEGSSYIFFDPEGFLAVAGGSISANQLEAGDTQTASIQTIPLVSRSISANQLEAGDTQTARIGDIPPSCLGGYVTIKPILSGDANIRPLLTGNFTIS